MKFRKKKREHSTIPFGEFFGATSTEINFDYTPKLIRERAYTPTKDNLKKWVQYSPVAHYLIETLPREALGEGVLINDRDVDIDLFLRCFIDARLYGISIISGIQLVSGQYIVEVKKDDFGAINEFRLTTGKVIPAQNIFYINTQDEMPYLLPIWDNLVFIYWIQYSMCEAAAREGSKFITVATQGLDSTNMNIVRSKFGGLSNRKIAVYDSDSVKEISAIDTKLNATFTDYISANLKMISLYSGVPEATLTGVNAGAVTGSEVNVGSLYAVYRTIQNEATPFLRKYLGIDTGAEVKWKKRYRMSEKEEEELKLLKVQRMINELNAGIKTIEEVRNEIELD